MVETEELQRIWPEEESMRRYWYGQKSFICKSRAWALIISHGGILQTNNIWCNQHAFSWERPSRQTFLPQQWKAHDIHKEGRLFVACNWRISMPYIHLWGFRYFSCTMTQPSIRHLSTLKSSDKMASICGIVSMKARSTLNACNWILNRCRGHFQTWNSYRRELFTACPIDLICLQSSPLQGVPAFPGAQQQGLAHSWLLQKIAKGEGISSKIHLID